VDVKALVGKGGACFPISLKSSFGPIRIHLPEGVGYEVTAHTSFGKVASQIPLTVAGSLSADSLSGKIGDGRCPLTLENSNGNIEILRGK
jgi:DUF4097 and DUF4098 domain-containing protein YvlB